MSKYQEESGGSESDVDRKSRKKKHDMRNFESEPESGECTDSDNEKKLKSAVKVCIKTILFIVSYCIYAFVEKVAVLCLYTKQ